LTTRILITGGAGFLGSVLCRTLLKDRSSQQPFLPPYYVTVVDTFRHNDNSLAECCQSDHFDVIKGDARDMRIMEPLVKKADVVLPLAALVGFPMCAADEVAATSTNLHAIANLMGLLSPDQQVIYPNSNSGYGTTKPGWVCAEDTPLNPITLYGRTKAEAERVVLDRENSIALRFATLFGASPRMRIDLLVNEFTHKAVSERSILIFEGHFRRNYLHVQDAAQAFLHGIWNFDKMKGHVYNAGLSDANMTKLELCAQIKKHIPHFIYVEAPMGEDPDRRDYVVSNEKLEATGWKARRSIDDGIVELCKLYRTLKNTRYGNV
jgi:nucleoside-diphosphate-sugar epimerase